MRLIFCLLFFISSLHAAGRFPVEFVNNSQIANDNEIYIITKGLDDNGDSCFIEINSNGISCKPVNVNTKSSDFSYKLSDLKKDTDTAVVFFPYLASGRIYISIGKPMDFQIKKEGNKSVVVDADGFKPRDVNYYTLYDKVEFSYVPPNAEGLGGGTWMNPTAVDFFSLPLRIEQEGSEVYQATGISISRNDLIKQVKSIFKTEDHTSTQEWNKLFLNYNKTLLRLMAPGKAMIPGIPGTNPMDQNYLANKEFSFIDHLWNYYRTNTLLIDTSEIQKFYKLDDYIFIGKVEGNDFVFTNRGDPQNKIHLPKPDNSIPWFAGAIGVFDAENNTPKAVIVRQLTSAFDVGLLPMPGGTIADRNYFDQQRKDGKYYTKNPLLPDTDTGPWFDLYSMSLHSLGEEQPIYTFAYDDALGQDGTLHDPHPLNVSKAVITIGDMSGTTIPDPFQDDKTYSVTILIGSGSNVTYQGKALKYGEVLNNVKVPMEVVLNGQAAKIYFDPVLVFPQFDAADGIAVEKISETGVNVTFPGIPQ